MSEVLSKENGISIEPGGQDTQLFQNLLRASSEKLRQRNHTLASWKSFEQDVDQALQSVRDEISELRSWKIHYVGGHRFPDIVTEIAHKKSLGIEVKTISSKESGWKVMGGSIMESTRIPDVARIYVFCAKKNPFEIRYRPFEDCVSSVAVTHSPRYMLDMEQPKSESIFSKIQIPYDRVRSLPNPFEPFRKELLKAHPDADVCWWQDVLAPNIETEIDREEERFAGVLLNTNLRFFADLSDEEKRDKRARMMILFPEVFEKRSKNQYRRASVWLYNHHIINPSMRDVFSAGGRSDVSAAVRRLEDLKGDIVKLFKFESVALFGNYNPAKHYKFWRDSLRHVCKDSAEQARLDEIVEEIGECIR